MTVPGVSRQWLDEPAAVHLTDDRVLRVAGRDGRRWLNAMLTADLRTAGPVAARYTLLLSAAGGVVSDAWVVEPSARDTTALALVLRAACAERVAETLEKALFNESLTLSFDDAIRVVSLQGPRGRDLLEGRTEAQDAYSCPRLGRDGIDVWVKDWEVESVMAALSAGARALGGGAVDAHEWSAARIALGVPLAGVDFDESTSPHEAGIEGRAVSFTKGCYKGQEVVARQQRAGAPARRLVQLAIEGSQPLAEGFLRGPGGEGVGRVTSVALATGSPASVLALAYLAEPFSQPGTSVFAGERTARVVGVVGRATTPTGPGSTR